jgi:hypothetical protein
MHTSIKIALATSALASAGLVGAAAPASAGVAQQCDSTQYPNKISTSGAGTTVYTNLTPGTVVCFKAGTAIDYVTVAEDGSITNTTLRNPNGNTHPLLGFSYYAYGNECVDNPYTYEDECNPDTGGGS